MEHGGRRDGEEAGESECHHPMFWRSWRIIGRAGMRRATTLKPARRNVRQQTLGVALLSLALLTAARRRVLAPYVAHPLRQQLDALASTAGTRFRGGGLCTM